MTGSGEIYGEEKRASEIFSVFFEHGFNNTTFIGFEDFRFPNYTVYCKKGGLGRFSVKHCGAASDIILYVFGNKRRRLAGDIT
jgi:hypothetical protein